MLLRKIAPRLGLELGLGLVLGLGGQFSLGAIVLEPCWTSGKKIKSSFTDLFCKREQIRSYFQMYSNLRKKSLSMNFLFCAVHFLINSVSQK